MPNELDQEMKEERAKIESYPIPFFFDAPFQLFHATSHEAYKSIFADGFIHPYKKEKSINPYNLTSPCFSRAHNLVSLFDFEAYSFCEYKEHFNCIYDPIRRNGPATIIFRISRDEISDSLFTYEEAEKINRSHRKLIPYLETWSKIPIPLSAIRNIILFPHLPLRSPYKDQKIHVFNNTSIDHKSIESEIINILKENELQLEEIKENPEKYPRQYHSWWMQNHPI